MCKQGLVLPSLSLLSLIIITITLIIVIIIIVVVILNGKEGGSWCTVLQLCVKVAVGPLTRIHGELWSLQVGPLKSHKNKDKKASLSRPVFLLLLLLIDVPFVFSLALRLFHRQTNKSY